MTLLSEHNNFCVGVAHGVHADVRPQFGAKK